MSSRGPLRGTHARDVWRVVRANWPLFMRWYLAGAPLSERRVNTDDDLLALLRLAGCKRKWSRRRHAEARLRELIQMDAVTLLGLVTRR